MLHPYELVAFQWSCHTIRERALHWSTRNGSMSSMRFKFRFGRALMEHLGESGTFLIWSLHENTVLNTISRHMHRYRYSDPQLEKWLDTVTSREGHPSGSWPTCARLLRLATSIQNEGKLSSSTFCPQSGRATRLSHQPGVHQILPTSPEGGL